MSPNLYFPIGHIYKRNLSWKTSFFVRFFPEFLRPATLLKKSLRHSCFFVNFVKFLRTLFVIEHLRWLLLQFCSFNSIYIVMEPLDMAFSSPSCPTVQLSMIQFNLLVFCHIVFLFLVQKILFSIKFEGCFFYIFLKSHWKLNFSKKAIFSRFHYKNVIQKYNDHEE